jgi:hypothetical protein
MEAAGEMLPEGRDAEAIANEVARQLRDAVHARPRRSASLRRTPLL